MTDELQDDFGFDTEPELSVQVEMREERPPQCADISGRAGTGKTTEIKRRVADDESYALLTATTGIAAVNLGSITINAALRYFDTNSLRDSFLAGHLTRTLHEIAQEYRWLAIDEKSMLDGDQLDYIYQATTEANRYGDIVEPLGLMLIGDAAQLPPIKAKWFFEASCWSQFEQNSTLLEKVWRQDDGPFLIALNFARVGRGADAAQ